MKQFYNHPFDPIINENSKVLILGTFPSIDSFKNNFYYGHKRNQFWKILSHIYKLNLDTTDDKLSFLKDKNIALWDVIKGCNRENSLDSNLKNIEINDIKELVLKYPNIKIIFFSSKKAKELYNKKYKDFDFRVDVLPSPSSANARMKIEEKITIYKNKLGEFI